MSLTATSLAAWLATYLLHSTLLLGGALVATRLLRSPAAREVLWKGALLGGLVTATLHGALGTGAGLAPIDLPLEGPAGRPITLQLPGERSPGGSRDGLRTAALEPVAQPPAPELLPTAQSGDPARNPLLWRLPWRLPWAGLLAAAWMGLAALRLTGLALAHGRVRRSIRGRRVVDGALLDPLLHWARERLGPWTGAVRVTASPALASPVALGRREVCLPQRALRELDAGELEAMLAHELAHLERRDPAWFLLAHVIERALCLQPLNAVVRRRLQADAELCCDDWAARRLAAPDQLARCLARVADWMEQRPAPALLAGMAHGPSALVARVERLLGPRPRRRRGTVAAALVAVIAALPVLAWAGPGVVVPAQDEPGVGARIGIVPRPEARGTDAALLLRIELGWQERGDERVLRYRLGEIEEHALEVFSQRLRLKLSLHPGAQVALALGTGLDPEHAHPLVRELYRAGAATVLVEGVGEAAGALRSHVLAAAPFTVRIRVEPDLRLRGMLPQAEGFSFPRTLTYSVADGWFPNLAELRKALTRQHEQYPHADARIDAPPGTRYEEVVAVLEVVAVAGFSHVGFLVSRPEEQEQGQGVRVRNVDVDGDGDLDLFVSQPGRMEFVDVDSDGDLDLYVADSRRFSSLDDPVLERLLRQLAQVDPVGGWEDPASLDAEIDRLSGELAEDPAEDPDREILQGRIRQYLDWQREILDSSLPVRTFIDIGPDGRMLAGDGFILLDPRQGEPGPDPYADLRSWLEARAGEMPRARDPESGLELPDGRLRLRVHPGAPMRLVQKVMESCGGDAVQIWRIEVALVGDGREVVYPVPLPIDVGVHLDLFPGKVEVLLRVRDEGRRVDPVTGRELTGEELGAGQPPFVFMGRELTYQVGPWKGSATEDLRGHLARIREENPQAPITIDPRPGTTFGDVAGVLKIVGELGFTDVTFVGVWPDDYK